MTTSDSRSYFVHFDDTNRGYEESEWFNGERTHDEVVKLVFKSCYEDNPIDRTYWNIEDLFVAEEWLQLAPDLPKHPIRSVTQENPNEPPVVLVVVREAFDKFVEMLRSKPDPYSKWRHHLLVRSE
jgi:hypothetical protein